MRGEGGDPEASSLAEKQQIIIDELKRRFDVQFGDLERLSREEVRENVDRAVHEIVDPIKSKVRPSSVRACVCVCVCMSVCVRECVCVCGDPFWVWVYSRTFINFLLHTRNGFDRYFLAKVAVSLSFETVLGSLPPFPHFTHLPHPHSTLPHP